METPESELTSYDGNCHCGVFEYTVKIPSKPSNTCDCSYCIRKGYKWISPIASSDLIIHSGEGTLTKYQFAGKGLTHYIRMLKNPPIQLDSNEAFFPGAAREPKYIPPELPTHPDEGNLAEGEVVLKGNCHCGAVRYAVKTESIEWEDGKEGQKVMCCNCSLCSRNSDLWIYPPNAAVILTGQENLTDYAFLSQDSLHCFCKICGVSMLVKVLEAGAEDMPINVRSVEGVELGKLKFMHYDGKGNAPKYEI